MYLKRLFNLISVSVISLSTFAGTFSLTNQEKDNITNEAEDWIDNMVPGLQDRLSDAVNHAAQGFYSEIQIFRNFKDTVGLKEYAVVVENLKGGSNGDIDMRLYKAVNCKKTENLPLLVYFHGGGWSVGSIDTSEKFCRALASNGNVVVISLEYPLAPEHPFPSALNVGKDAVKYIFGKANQWGCSPDQISLGGDGAGGNLALHTFELLPDDVSIKSLVIFYPLFKTSGDLNPDLKRKFGRGFGFDSRVWESFQKAYNSPENIINKTLPPTLIINAGRDIVVDEVMEFVSNNNVVEYIEFSGALHGFITDGQQKTAFNKAVEFTDAFLSK